MKKRTVTLQSIKPRNTTYRVLAQCKGGKMEKNHKQLRRAAKVQQQKGLDDTSKPFSFEPSLPV